MLGEPVVFLQCNLEGKHSIQPESNDGGAIQLTRWNRLARTHQGRRDGATKAVSEPVAFLWVT